MDKNFDSRKKHNSKYLNKNPSSSLMASVDAALKNIRAEHSHSLKSI